VPIEDGQPLGLRDREGTCEDGIHKAVDSGITLDKPIEIPLLLSTVRDVVRGEREKDGVSWPGRTLEIGGAFATRIARVKNQPFSIITSVDSTTNFSLFRAEFFGVGSTHYAFDKRPTLSGSDQPLTATYNGRTTQAGTLLRVQ
jgi:hypothetical protein